MFALRDIFITALVFGLLPVAVYDPFVGIALWTWISVMNPHRLTWEWAYTLPFAQAIAIATFIGVAYRWHRSVKFPFTAPTITLMVFMAWMTVTLIFSFHFQGSLDMWVRVEKTLLMTLVALALVRTERQISIFLWIFVLSIAFFGIKGGIFTLLTGGNFRVFGPPDSHVGDNNAISVALIIIIPLMYYLAQHATKRWIRWAMFVSIGLSAVAVVGSYSRGAFLAVFAMAAFLVLKSRRKFMAISAFVLSLPLVILMMPDRWYERMETIKTYDMDESVLGRFNAWHMAWNLARDHPILGGGFDIYDPDVFARYAPDPADIHSAHSIYFQMMGEHGFVGLAIFLLLGILMWRTGTHVIKSSRNDPATSWRADLARALQVSLIGFGVGGITVNIGYWDVIYFELVLMVALDQLCRQAPQVQTETIPAQQPGSRPAAIGGSVGVHS